jgi:hypothetical protein
MAKHPFPWRVAFLDALRSIPVVAHACAAVGIERSTAYRARNDSEDFAKEWDEAIEAGVDRAEQEAFRRGVVGFEEPLVHQGNITWLVEHYDRATGETVPDDVAQENGLKILSKDPEVRKSARDIGWRYKLDPAGQRVPVSVRKHSDALLALYLKGRRKRVFADRTEITGADGGNLTITDDTARAARTAQLLALAQARKDAKAAEPPIDPDTFDLA